MGAAEVGGAERWSDEVATPGIHQILVSASPGDAITNMAFAIRDVLRSVGPSEIFAHHIPAELADDVLPLSAYRVHHARNVLVFHASIGQPRVHEFLTSRSEQLVLVYHNVTSPEYFEPYDLVFAELLALGKREVELLRPRVSRAIAASEFNARELEAMGYRDVRVAPPAVDLRRLTTVAPRESTLHHLDSFDGQILLFVGQILPHKRPDFLVRAMHVGFTYLGLDAFLLLVGHQRLPRYARAIREQVRELNLPRVHVVPAVDDADLVAMFRKSAAVITASEHEGFCLPLVEAMAFEKPIVARACGAVPEIVGDAGLLLPAHAGPSIYAEALAELLGNPPLQDALVAKGRRRLTELESVTPDRVILESLLEVV